MKANLTLITATAVLLASCATERTHLANGERIEWRAKEAITQKFQVQATHKDPIVQEPVVGEVDLNVDIHKEEVGYEQPALGTDVSASVTTHVVGVQHPPYQHLKQEYKPTQVRPLNPSPEEDDNDKTNGMAIAGFVTSFFFPIVGIVLSAIALGQINRRGGRGKGLATAGLVIGIVTVMLILLLFI
jgi:hypothetical protein